MVDSIDVTSVDPYEPATYNAAREFSLQATEKGHIASAPLSKLEKIAARVRAGFNHVFTDGVYGLTVEPLRERLASFYENSLLPSVEALPEQDPRRRLLPALYQDAERIRTANSTEAVQFYSAWAQYAQQLMHPDSQVAEVIEGMGSSPESYLSAAALTMFDYMSASRAGKEVSPSLMPIALEENLLETESFRVIASEQLDPVHFHSMLNLVERAKEYAKNTLGQAMPKLSYGNPPGTSLHPA